MNEENRHKVAEMRLIYRNPQPPEIRVKIKSSYSAADVLRKHYPEDQMDCKEFVKVILMNKASEVLGCVQIAEGGKSGAYVDVGSIVQSALLANASEIILSHNHPSGSLKPSAEDLNLTRRLEDACLIMGITMTDHIILTSHGHYSFADEGILDKSRTDNPLKARVSEVFML